MKSKLYALLSIILIASNISLPTTAFAKVKTPKPAQKERLVLMPLKVSEEDKALQGAMENALVEGLSRKYEVFAGERVRQKMRESFNKESASAKHDCDATRCMQDIAIAFNAELIATANVTKQTGGYFLTLSIQNIMDEKAVYSNTLPCEGCNAYKVADKLKELAGVERAVGVTTEPPVVPPTNMNNATLSINCSGEDVGAQIWVDGKLRAECPADIKVPEGQLKVKLVKAVDADHERVFEQEVNAFADSTKRLDAKLNLQLTAEGVRKEEEKKRFIEQQRLSAEAGDIAAMLALGDRFYNGDGVQQNKQEAEQWYLKAANAGSEIAQFKISGLDDGKQDAKEILHMLSLPNENAREVNIEGEKSIQDFINKDEFFEVPGGNSKATYSYETILGGDLSPNQNSEECQRNGRLFELENEIQSAYRSSWSSKSTTALGGLILLKSKANLSIFDSAKTSIKRISRLSGKPFPLVSGKRFGAAFTFLVDYPGAPDYSVNLDITCAVIDSQAQSAKYKGTTPLICLQKLDQLNYKSRKILKYYWDEPSGCFMKDQN